MREKGVPSTLPSLSNCFFVLLSFFFFFFVCVGMVIGQTATPSSSFHFRVGFRESTWKRKRRRTSLTIIIGTPSPLDSHPTDNNQAVR